MVQSHPSFNQPQVFFIQESLLVGHNRELLLVFLQCSCQFLVFLLLVFKLLINTSVS